MSVRHCPRCGHLLADLDDRDQMILRAIAAGRSNADIARMLHASPSSAANMISRLYRKLGITGSHPRRQAVALADQLDLLGGEQ